MPVKFISDSNESVSIYCDLCGNIVYATKESSSTEAIWYQKQPFISKTYKIYCERCYMVPLFKIKELVSIVEGYQVKEEKKVKRIRKSGKRRIENEKKKLEEIHNELY